MHLHAAQIGYLLAVLLVSIFVNGWSGQRRFGRTGLILASAIACLLIAAGGIGLYPRLHSPRNQFTGKITSVQTLSTPWFAAPRTAFTVSDGSSRLTFVTHYVGPALTAGRPIHLEYLASDHSILGMELLDVHFPENDAPYVDNEDLKLFGILVLGGIILQIYAIFRWKYEAVSSSDRAESSFDAQSSGIDEQSIPNLRGS